MMFPLASCTLCLGVTILASAGIDLVGAHTQTQRDFNPNQLYHTDVSGSRPVKNVAIIGAGAGGSSAAYFMSQYAKLNPYGPRINIQVFEKSGRVGGRALPRFFGTHHDKYELGALAFVPVNYNLVNASRDFGIALEPVTIKNFSIGLYDGEKFVARHGPNWFKNLAFYFRYGWGFLRGNRFANHVKNKFLKLYDESVPLTKA
ncbi:hypothetical protein L0F63_002224 [Massospora cicadina]|nr:hypothetical protein L0F63_002224 [Massospora cicadina]